MFSRARLAQIVCFPKFDKGCSFSRAKHKCMFSAQGRGCMFSLARQRLYVFPRKTRVVSFPALGSICNFFLQVVSFSTREVEERHMVAYLLGSKSDPNSLLSTPSFRLQTKSYFDSIRKQTSAQNGLEKITKPRHHNVTFINKLEVKKKEDILTFNF